MAGKSIDELLVFTPIPYDDSLAVSAARHAILPADLILPSYHNGKPVTLIESEGFRNHGEIESLVLPEKLRGIFYTAFSACTNLTNITFNSCLEFIDEDAFYHCSKLSSLCFPESLTSIKHYAFGHCTNLLTVTIPDSVTNIGAGNFLDSRLLKAIKCNHDSYAERWASICGFPTIPIKSKLQELLDSPPDINTHSESEFEER